MDTEYNKNGYFVRVEEVENGYIVYGIVPQSKTIAHDVTGALNLVDRWLRKGNFEDSN